MNANIAARLELKARDHPSRVAIVDRHRTWLGGRRQSVTFSELADRVAGVAAGLMERGVTRGDRVLLFVPMSLDLYVALLAVLHVGAEAVFVDAWAGRARIDAAIAAAAPRAWIGNPRAQLLRFISRAVRNIPISIVVGGIWSLRRLERKMSSHSAAEVAPEATALVTFTTGSTGRPKAAARSHAFLWAQHLALAAHLRLDEHDVDMPTLPVFVLNNLAMGVTSVIPDFSPARPADIDPHVILASMREEGVTTLVASPAFCDVLCTHVLGAGSTLPLRRLFTGGAPVLPPLVRALARAMPADAGSRAEVIYGSTEAEPVSGIDVVTMLAFLNGPGGATRPAGLCVGRPVEHIAVKIINPQDGPVELDAFGWDAHEVIDGETGEIVVAGDHVLTGYLNNPAADRINKIRDGNRVWHRTGDGGYRDAEGLLWLTGRVQQRVVRAGTVWWPLEAELRAFQLAGVRHAAYLALPTSGRAVLCVEAPGAMDRNAAEHSLRQLLDPWPVDAVVFLSAIPRDPRHRSKTDFAALLPLLDG